MILDKRKLHHYLRVARQLKIWQLVVVFVLMAFVSATLLRLNNLGMVDHRDAVIAADEKGDKEEIQQSLLDLQSYVSSHMNTSLEGGVQLKESFNRDYDKFVERVAENRTNPNSRVYEQASVECRSRFVGGVESFRNDYVQCVQSRVSALNPANDTATEELRPNPVFYTHDFVSPLWTPDAAGISVLITLLIGMVIIFRLLFVTAVKLLLKRRYKQIYS